MARRCYFLLCAALTLTLISGCALLPQREEAKTPPVLRSYQMEEYKTEAAVRGDIVKTQRINCYYTPVKQQKLSFSINGSSLETLAVARGDTVAEGQLLAALEQGMTEMELERSAFELENLRLELAQLESTWDAQVRLAALEGEDIESELQLERETLTLELEALEAKTAELEQTVEASCLYAPFDGTVTYIKDFSADTRSQAGETVVTVADKSSCVFTVTDEDETPLFSVGDRVEITLSSTRYPATVVEPESVGGAAPAVYLALDDYIPELRDNASGVVILELERADDVISVPSTAVKSYNGQSVVYVPDQQGYKTVRYVETGFSAAGKMEIISGLSEGELVIIK